MKQAIDFEDVLTSLIVGQRRTGHCALPCFHHVHSLKPPFTVSPTCLQLGDLRAHKLQGAPVRPGANWNHQLAEVQLFGDHRLSVPSQTGLWILQPWPIKQVGQHRCVIKMCHLLLLRSFPRTPGTEATPLPHQEQREGKLHVRPGRSGGNEVGTSGGDPRGGAHERHLVLSRWLHQEQGKAGPGRFYTSPPVHKLGGNHFKLHWLHRCSWPRTWASKLWATSNRQPRWFCGRRAGSPSRRGRPRWEVSSPASPSQAWSWMSKVLQHICFLIASA